MLAKAKKKAIRLRDKNITAGFSGQTIKISDKQKQINPRFSCFLKAYKVQFQVAEQCRWKIWLKKKSSKFKGYSALIHLYKYERRRVATTEKQL